MLKFIRGAVATLVAYTVFAVVSWWERRHEDEH